MAAKITLDKAKEICDAWAVGARRLRAADTAFEERVSALREEHKRATSAERTAVNALADRLLAYCRRNQEELAVPVLTVHGVFGLRESSSLTIADGQERAILAYLHERQYTDCIKPPVDETIVKNAIKNRIERGETIPHSAITTKRQAYIDILDALNPPHRPPDEETRQ
jgi:hypothetical protein